MTRQPYFAPRGPAAPPLLISNPGAPIIEIKIIMDCRFNPPTLQLMAPSNMPASVIMKAFNDSMGTLLNMQIAQDMKAAQGQTPPADKPPDLPPAPDTHSRIGCDRCGAPWGGEHSPECEAGV